MTRHNDPDRRAVYYAESLTFTDTLFDEPIHSSEFMYLAGQLFSHDWWVSNKIPVPFFEPTNGGHTSSHATVRSTRIGGESLIRMAPCDINPRVLAHEAAHIAQFHFYNPDYVDVPGHGREFRACYLNVAEILLGRDAARALKANFDQRLRDDQQVKRDPGWILTVPDVDRALDNEGVGLFPAWRAREQATEFEGLRQRIMATVGVPRINGAIAL